MSDLAKKYPCLEYNLSVIKEEAKKLELFCSFLKTRGLALDTMEAFTALYASMGLFSRRYTRDEINAINVSEVSCNTIETGCGTMCFSCPESDKYSNRWYDEECQIIAACFAFDGFRESLKRRYKSKAETLFCSHVRASMSSKEDLYLPVNRYVFNGYDTIFFEWIKRMGADDELVNDLAQRAFPAINDTVKEAYPNWKASNEEFLRAHIKELIYRAVSVKQPMEYYMKLASKMYESSKPVKAKKAAHMSNSLPQESLGNVGVLLTTEALVADYNAKQKEKIKAQRQDVELVATEKEPDKVSEKIEVSAVDVIEPTVKNEDSILENEPDVIKEDLVLDSVDSLESVEESAKKTVDIVEESSTASIDELRKKQAEKVQTSESSKKKINTSTGPVLIDPRRFFDERLKHPPVPFRLSLTYSSVFDRGIKDTRREEPEWRNGLWECCEAFNIVYVDSPAKLESLDVTILGNDIVACEIVKEALGEYLLMYLPKQSIFVLLLPNMLAQSSAILTTFFKLKNTIKLTCYPLPLMNWLCRELLPCEGIVDIRTLSGMIWYDRLKTHHIDEICDYETFIGILCGMTSNGTRPDVIYGMPKYRVIYLEARRVLGQDSRALRLKREMAYLLLVGRSYNLLGIIENCSIPYLDYDVTHEGLGKVEFDFTSEVTFPDRGCLVSGKFLSQEREKGGLFSAYKEVCIKIVLSHYFEKYEPMLIQFNEESGLVFYVSERDCADFYTLLNRYLLQCGRFYVSSEPVISMEIKSV